MFQFMVEGVTGVASGKKLNMYTVKRYATEKALIGAPYFPRLHRAEGSCSFRHLLMKTQEIDTM